MVAKLQYLVIHCTDTRGMRVTPEMIRKWHMDPPPAGRGWDRVGYSDMILRNGSIINLTPYDDDDYITSDEMTWGAVGYNAIGRHVVLVGGKGSKGKFEDHFTIAQEDSLVEYVEDTIIRHPDIIIIGHNQVAKKTCPGFDVYDWLKSHYLCAFGDKNLRK